MIEQLPVVLKKVNDLTTTPSKCWGGMYGSYTSGLRQNVWGETLSNKIPSAGDGYGTFSGLAYGPLMDGVGTETADDALNVVKDGVVVASIGKRHWSNEDFQVSSDARLKSNVVRIKDALKKVLSTGGYTFTRNDLEGNPKQMGHMAQEILEICPEAVTGGPTEDNPDGMYSIKYGILSAVIFEAIRDLNDRDTETLDVVSKLSAQVKSQQKAIDELTKKINEIG